MECRFSTRMHLSAVISALLLLFPSILAKQPFLNIRPVGDTTYLLAVPSKVVGGTKETLCVTVSPSQPVSLLATLEYNENSGTLLRESRIVNEYYRCVPFQIPVVRVDSVASINIQIKGSTTFQNKTTMILISPPAQLIFIETDKPIYKPGQTLKFRIVSLDMNFYTYNQTFPTIELQDPNSNRIGQWLNVSTNSGLVDLSYPLNSEATNGFYVITAWDNNNEEIKETFEVKDYVLPKFEVTVDLPSVITILDTSATLKVCAKYTYGKPVNGKVTAVVCHNAFQWFISSSEQLSNICKNYTTETDKMGCGQFTLNLNEYAMTDSRYEQMIDVQTEVQEYGTDLIMKGSGSSSITTNIVTLSFEDSPMTFKPGMMYEGTIKVTGANSEPVKRKPVYLTLSLGQKDLVQTLITNDKGIAVFNYPTASWGLQDVSLKVRYEKRTVEYENDKLTPYYPIAYLWLQPFYSKSQSFIELKRSPTPFSCNKYAHVLARYVIHENSFRASRSIFQWRTRFFYYMVMSRGHVVQQGRLLVPLRQGRETKGTVVLLLQNMDKLPPVAQVVMYTLLSSGEAVADSMNFPVQPCLKNKVSLNFSSPSELPGVKTSLTLNAAPGSLCSVKAIDKSLLLLQPEKELNIESVFNMLPVQMLSGYPYNIIDDDDCGTSPPFLFERVERRFHYIPFGKVDVYNIFKDVGIKILTNADIRNMSECSNEFLYFKNPVAFAAAAGSDRERVVFGGLSDQPVVTVRKYFPETWIWDLVSVNQSGHALLNKTVPDSITTWQADAFCTSPVGFGIANKTDLTAFQPFFVSLTMPNSVIRGEVFTLKATVFNYLQGCVMVNVILAQSKQFSAQNCKNCSYTQCLCADESVTLPWTITPLVLGEVTINVTAAASPNACGKTAAFVPQKGRIDTVINTLLVQAEGSKQYKSYNELICPSEGAVEKTVSLTLPEIMVEDSAMASVSLLGDLMGRALQNLASLLAMPYGCGEQNMLLFAPNIFILDYLNATNQLTAAIRSKTETYLVSGYQRELNYKHDDGSYSAFGNRDESGNTWLTAFVMKSFGRAKQYIFIDQVFVDQAKEWLGKQQQENGCFASVGQLFHTPLKGGVNDEVTLSAYITAAMLELNYTITDSVVSNGLSCLRNAYPQVNSTYARALLFYTFTLAGDQGMRNTLISDLDSEAIISGGGRHWSRVNDESVLNSMEVEMTSYVLLALMSGPPLPGFDLGYSSSIVFWLSKQQNAFGGYASTQDTVVALQALSKYSLATYSPSGVITVTVTSPSAQISTFTINQSNRLLYQETQLQEVPGEYTVKAKGNGCVYIQFTLHYNIPPPPDHSSFSILASAFGNCRVPNPSLEVTVTVMYNGNREKTNMVVIEVRPLSGFTADETSVNLVTDASNTTDGVVKRVDLIEGNVIIYLEELTKGSEKQYTLTIVQENEVQNLKPAVVKVYDYYETGDEAVTEYPSPCPVQ